MESAEKINRDLKSKEKRIDRFVASLKIFRLATRIVRHEIANELVRLAYCEHKIKAGKTEALPRVLQEIQTCRKTIPEVLKLLSDDQPTPVSLAAVCRTVFSDKYATVHFDQEVTAEVPMLPLVSIVNNVYENAGQAYQRRFENMDGFHVDVYLKDSTLYIEDNAGGFDVEDIASEKTGKGSGCGTFLAAFLNETGHLGIQPAIERTEKGTRVLITFDKIQRKLE